jgi:hypothetical protein
MHVFTVNVIEGRFIVSCPDLSGASRRAILPFLRDSACVCTGARSSPIGISCPAVITDTLRSSTPSRVNLYPNGYNYSGGCELAIRDHMLSVEAGDRHCDRLRAFISRQA